MTDEREGELADYLGYALKRVTSLVQGDLVQVLAPFQLRITSFSALTVIVGRPGLTQTELAETLSIERSHLVQIIDGLAGNGWIERTAVAGDRRHYALLPTEEGVALLESARAAVRDHEARVFRALAARERAELGPLLAKIRAT
jgi:DNA-binding MarR family transcriptional regulator